MSKSYASAEENEAHLRRRLNRLCYGINMDYDLDFIAEVAKDVTATNDQTLVPSTPTAAVASPTPSTSNLRAQLNADLELNKLLVKYIVKGSRILFCEKVGIWKNFAAENPTFSTQLNCAELRDFFVKRVLPEIFSLDFAEEWERTFEMLEVNENFQRVQSGFVLKTNIKNSKKINMPIIYDVDYKRVAAKDIDKIDKEEAERRQHEESNLEDVLMDEDPKFELETQKSNPAPSQFIVVTDVGAAADTPPNVWIDDLPTRMSSENIAILSAVVGTDFEIFHSAAIDKDEILKRLKKAREEFMKSGRITINLNPEALVAKVQKLHAIRDAVADIMNKRF